MPRHANADIEALETLTHVEVWRHGLRVGTIAQPNHRSACLFEYDRRWLQEGFALAPYSLELSRGVKAPPSSELEGLHGIFADSLPGDWGRLLVNRKLRMLGTSAERIGPLGLLSIVGENGPGALEYRPVFEGEAHVGDGRNLDLDALSKQCQAILDDRDSGSIDELYARGGSSGGARPKVGITLDGEPWFVKFPTREDGTSAGADEHQLMVLANSCGIRVPEVRLLPSTVCDGFFATKRFDRTYAKDGNPAKIHMASASALLERSPFEVTDYRELMALCLDLTQDVRDCKQLFLVMCLNVLAGNQDDHLRNFSFLYDEERRAWHLSPAYDLTRVENFMGEHTTLVNGKGTGISRDDLVRVGRTGGITPRRARSLLETVREVIEPELGLSGDFVG